MERPSDETGYWQPKTKSGTNTKTEQEQLAKRWLNQLWFINFITGYY